MFLTILILYIANKKYKLNTRLLLFAPFCFLFIFVFLPKDRTAFLDNFWHHNAKCVIMFANVCVICDFVKAPKTNNDIMQRVVQFTWNFVKQLRVKLWQFWVFFILGVIRTSDANITQVNVLAHSAAERFWHGHTSELIQPNSFASCIVRLQWFV